MIDAGLLDRRHPLDHRRPSAQGHLLDLDELPYGELGLPQYETERMLTRHLAASASRSSAASRWRRCADADDGHRRARPRRRRDGDRALPLRGRLRRRAQRGAPRAGHRLRGRRLPDGVHAGRRADRLGPAARHGAAGAAAGRGRAPDMFIAIPLPEPGRYRVSMLAPPDACRGRRHRPRHPVGAAGPGAPALQAVANDLLPETAAVATCAGRRCFASACGSRILPGAAASSSPATPRTSIRRPAARA